MVENGKEPNSESAQMTVEPGSEKFTPTCRICGRQHWPLDPSCIGKKGVRAEAKARAQAEKLAKAEAKARARAEGKARAEAEANGRVQKVAYAAEIEEVKERLNAERKTRVEAQEKAVEYERARDKAERRASAEQQARVRAEEKLKFECQERARIEAKAETKIWEAAEARSEDERKLREELEQRARAYGREIARAEDKVKSYGRELKEVEERLESEIRGRLKAENEAQAVSEKLAKAKARLKSQGCAKAERIARARVKADAKVRRQGFLEEIAELKKRLEGESSVWGEREANLLAEVAAAKTEKEVVWKMLDEERMGRTQTEAELNAAREARVRAEEQAAEYARQREEVRQWAILAEQEKLKAQERLKSDIQGRSIVEARAEATMRAEAEAMARVDSKERQSETDEHWTQDEGCGEEMLREDKGNRVAALLGLRARDIMQRETIWCSPEESIEAVLAKMRRAGCDEVIVGRDGAAEGIVARSELKGRVGPHLRRAMGRWRKDGSDATFGMPVKFAMIRGVRSIGEGTSVTAIMKIMRQSGWRALAVVDGEGKARGLVTACSVLKIRALLRLESNPRLLSARAGLSRDAVGAAKAEIKVFDMLRPSGVFRRAQKKSRTQVPAS